MFSTDDRRNATQPQHLLRIERALCTWVVWGAILVLLLPAARAHTAWLGWLPMWLVAMPVSAWWALRRFGFPTTMKVSGDIGRARRRRAPQARRRGPALRTACRLRAA